VKKRLNRRARLRSVRDFIKQSQAMGRDLPADQQRYYGEVSQFLRSYLSESLGIDAVRLTAEEIETTLRQLGQNGLSAPVKNILQRCEQVLYSPQGLQLGASWRDQVQTELSKFAEMARH
jgi:isopentenyl diphosphate isomerase/L-lactate dehydrogenase-like FMN-dependent dehydrogenase